MIEITQSMEHWLFENHREKLPLIMLGHIEMFTDEMAQEYLAWLETDDGKQYLKGGSKYDPNHAGNIACEKFAESQQEIETPFGECNDTF